MKKTVFGTLVALSLVAFVGCNGNSSATPDAKCGGDKQEAKCGGNTEAAKCGADTKETKCGAGKCGGDK